MSAIHSYGKLAGLVGRPCNVPGGTWNSTEPLIVLAWRLEYALPNATLDVVEVMAPLQQSMHQRWYVGVCGEGACSDGVCGAAPAEPQPGGLEQSLERPAAGTRYVCARSSPRSPHQPHHVLPTDRSVSYSIDCIYTALSRSTVVTSWQSKTKSFG